MRLFSIRSRLSDYEVQEGTLESFRASVRPETDFLLVDLYLINRWPGLFEGLVPPGKLIAIQATERHKTVAYASTIIEKIMEVGISKRSRILSMGGGIVQDLSGFIASILYRGLVWNFYPSTLLAQSDSCIGAKTSINFKSFKNLLGTFYNPTEVVLIPELLNTLTKKEYLSGLGEIIKLHIIGGPETTALMQNAAAALQKGSTTELRAAILRALTVKKGFIEEDEFDKGVRNLLNYGHCFGHAIESSSHYAVPHGQAVTIGMVLANRISVARGKLSPERALVLERGLFAPFVQKKNWNLPLDTDRIVEAMKRDKKRISQRLVVVALEEAGLVKNDDVEEGEVREQVLVWNRDR